MGQAPPAAWLQGAVPLFNSNQPVLLSLGFFPSLVWSRGWSHFRQNLPAGHLKDGIND